MLLQLNIEQMDSLDITDRFYEKKYQDMETRLYRLYDEIEGVENSISEVKNRLLNIKQKKISEDNVYQFLLYFDKLYDKFNDLEKKEFLSSFVEQVDICESRLRRTMQGTPKRRSRRRTQIGSGLLRKDQSCVER